MAGSEISPTEVGKNPKIIKAAQEELDAMDVFVCGRCHSVFHFIEEFKSHKEKTCQKDQSNIRDCNESNPKIWAFLLWKEAQAQNKNLNTANRNSWALYQTWVKMDDSQRGTWIVAGKTIQSFSKVGKGGLTETPVKITKTVVNNSNSVAGRKPLTQAKPQVTNLKAPARPVGNRTTAKGTENESLPTKGSPLQKAAGKLTNDTGVTTTDKNLSRRAKRTIPNSTEIADENVEKIVAKRFNPRCKMHEYLVKWENADLDQNTWEPATHLENVPHLLETFEKQLARQKELRAAMQAKQQQAQAKVGGDVKKEEGTLPTVNQATNASSPDSTRPARNSKTKAMDQVKQWVSSGTNASTAAATPVAGDKEWNAAGVGGPVKRKLDDSSELNSSGNAMEFNSSTMEDLEDDLIPSHTVKRLKNGSAVSVEVKTKNEKNIESKVIKVNGRTSVSGETLPVGADSADVIITQDANASGVVKKPGFENLKKNSTKPEGHIRVLTKSESAVSNSGIVRLNDDSSTKTPVRTTPLRVGNQLNSTTTIRQVPQRVASGTTIQRKTVSVANNGKTTMQPTVRTTAQPAPQSGRMFVARQNAANRPLNATPTNPAANKPVTPEQKILQLSKSGDLKVTKKVMTREDAVARMNPAQRQQQQRQQQQQQQQQSQVQIQKVQQLQQNAARAGTQISINSRAKPVEQQSHEAQLCPITGKLLGQEEPAAAQNQANEQQQQLAAEQQQQQQQQQQLQNMDSALLLGNDQQMLTNEDGTPLLVTGEDGTVYQVAGKNAQGQTILVTQGPDGEQQFAYVAAAESDENQMTLDNVVAEAVAQLPAEQQAEALAAAVGEGQYLVKTTQEDGTTQVVTMSEAELAQHQALAAQQQQQQQQQQIAGAAGNNVDATGQLCVQTEAGDGQEANIPAEVVQADLPSPGGTRRVVLLLQDGTYMMTEMHDDEFKALNIAA